MAEPPSHALPAAALKSQDVLLVSPAKMRSSCLSPTLVFPLSVAGPTLGPLQRVGHHTAPAQQRCCGRTPLSWSCDRSGRPQEAGNAKKSLSSPPSAISTRPVNPPSSSRSRRVAARSPQGLSFPQDCIRRIGIEAARPCVLRAYCRRHPRSCCSRAVGHHPQLLSPH